MIVCPNCGMENTDDSRWCSACGDALPMPAAAVSGRLSGKMARSHNEEYVHGAPAAAVAAATAPARAFCVHCGGEVLEGDRFCPACGKNPQKPDAAPVPVSPPVKASGANISVPKPSIPKVSVKLPAKKSSRPRNDKRISVAQEMKLLLEEGTAILLGETRNLIISLLFPLGAALVTVWIAGENMYENFESTKSACFILVCAAIWGGLFNSIQVIVKERENVKRDYVSGALRIECFTASRALIQMVLCAIQALVLCLSFLGVDMAYGNSMPSVGIIFPSTFFEYYISVFLVMFAADTMGLMISCFVKSEQLASQLSPYILIVQLLFSGVLFAMEGAAESVSALMLSRWGMEALGSISELNSLPLRIVQENSDLKDLIDRDIDSAFRASTDHLWEVWFILILFVIVPLIIGDILLHRVKKDSRD